jgi:hypothetical protein
VTDSAALRITTKTFAWFAADLLLSAAFYLVVTWLYP